MANFNEIGRILWLIKRSDSWMDASYDFLMYKNNKEFQAELILHRFLLLHNVIFTVV
jgi:hypothetical protein